MTFKYKGKEVTQKQNKSNGDYTYKCDGQTFGTILDLEDYIDPVFAAKREEMLAKKGKRPKKKRKKKNEKK